MASHRGDRLPAHVAQQRVLGVRAVVVGRHAVERLPRLAGEGLLPRHAPPSDLHRAHATAADRIGADVQRLPEARQLVGDDRGQRRLADVADRRVEETGAHGPVGLDHGRHPRRVAGTGRERASARQRGVVLRQPPQLAGDSATKPDSKSSPCFAIVSSTIAANSSISPASSDRSAGRDRSAAAERRGRHVGGKKGDAVERHRPRVIDEPRQLAEVQPVQRRARGDRHAGREAAQPRHALLDQPSARTPRTA